jgi:hypothetical protein
VSVPVDHRRHGQRDDPHLKENALRLADDHREHCTGGNCTVSLVALGLLLKRAGYELSEADIRRLT